MLKNKPLCKYGSDCYRQKNKEHVAKFSHKDSTDQGPNPGEKRKNTRQSSQHAAANIEQKVKTKEPEVISTDDESISVPKKLKLDENSQATTKGEYFSDLTHLRKSSIISAKKPEEVKKLVLEKYGIEFPDDLYQFAEFSKTLNDETDFSDNLESLLGIMLVGPFDLFYDYKDSVDFNVDWLTHWRFYHDTPELFTVIVGSGNKLAEDQFHVGYFFDDPNQNPVGLVSNSAEINGKLSFCGQNIFSVVNELINKELKEKGKAKSKTLEELQDNLHKYAKGHDISLELKSKTTKEREKLCVSKTLNGFGLVVPVVNDVGYRELPETDSDLKKMFKKIVETPNENERLKAFEPLDEIVTLVQFANDECDYGEGIELGLDLLAFGGDVFNNQIESLLSLGYELVQRKLFADIVKLHMQNRRQGVKLCNIKYD